jgi:hypothetical protein
MPSLQVGGVHPPEEFRIRGPDVAFPAGPSPLQSLAVIRYQWMAPGAGRAVSAPFPVVVARVKIRTRHESVEPLRSKGSVEPSPR